MRRAARTDANHTQIVRLFERLGFSVADTSGVGGGFPDIVVGRAGLNYLVEIKDGDKPTSERKLTPKQVDFHGAWRGQVCVVQSEDDVIKHLGSSRAKDPHE